MLLDIQQFFKDILGNHVAIAALSGALVAWITTLFTIRKDEKNVYIKQITEERTKWREEIRKITEEIIEIHTNKTVTTSEKNRLRAKLAIRLNPSDEVDNQILLNIMLLINDRDSIRVFTEKISLLLKHDWERVKWESMPFYTKWFSYLFIPKNLEWKIKNYRNPVKAHKEFKRSNIVLIPFTVILLACIFFPIILLTFLFILYVIINLFISSMISVYILLFILIIICLIRIFR